MASTTETLVFSYGSNLCVPRIEARVGRVTEVSVGFVTHRRLAFHKRSIDGSAKADAAFVDAHTAAIWGVVYRLSADGKRKLDQFEFLGTGYDQIQVDVQHGGQATSAWMYVARPEVIDPSLQPYRWYRDLIVHGAIHHRLPADYVEFIRSQPTIEDPDSHRHVTNMSLIESTNHRMS